SGLGEIVGVGAVFFALAMAAGWADGVPYPQRELFAACIGGVMLVEFAAFVLPAKLIAFIADWLEWRRDRKTRVYGSLVARQHSDLTGARSHRWGTAATACVVRRRRRGRRRGL